MKGQAGQLKDQYTDSQTQYADSSSQAGQYADNGSSGARAVDIRETSDPSLETRQL
jgi:hypothetical protein